MTQLTEMTELSDTELDTVSGGFLDFGNIVTQTNVAANVNLSLLSLVGQAILQQNSSNI